MKKSCLISVLLVLALVLASCTTSKTIDPTTTAKIIWDSSTDYSSQTEFAVNELKSAFNKANIALVDEGEIWTIELGGFDETLGEEAYTIWAGEKRIVLNGGDCDGLMYGALDVAEQIEIGGLESVASKSVEPNVKQRMIMYHLTLDMRAPTYNTPGDAGQKNIENVWDLGFWHEFFDDMAKNRLNSIGFECLDVFPSLVKVPGYEDVVLDDVWRTTIAFDNSYSGDCTDLVRPEHWENYEVVKKMTIDEKIEFWQEVMEYARSRGVDVYFLFGHIYTFAEQGKYGITNDIENPVTKDYYYKSAKAMLETYPLIKGFGLSPGENMGWDKAPEAYAKNVWWMHDVYVPAINEVLEKDENRSFDIFLHTQASENFGSIFSDCKANINFRIGLAGTHMYASSKPPVYELNASLENLPKGSKLLLTFRNEDCFDLRWGDAEFVREFIATIPNREEIFGFITGSDGYSYARDYSSTDKDLQGQLYMQKHYLNFMLFGRLAYDNSLSDEALYQIFDNHFDGQKGTRELYDTTAIASKIIPLVNKIYFQDNGDYTWFVQGNWSHPNTFGFIDIKRWMRSNNVYFDSNAMSIEDYALSVAASESLSTELVIPPEIARELRTYSETVLANIEALKTTVKKSKKLSLTEKNFWALVDDDIAMAYLGLFYSERILGAVNIRVFNETNNEDFKTEAVANLQRSYKAFEKYATIMSTNYVAQQFSRVGSYDVLANLELVKKDIEIAKTWKPRPLPKTTNAPSKAMFFKDSN